MARESRHLGILILGTQVTLGDLSLLDVPCEPTFPAPSILFVGAVLIFLLYLLSYRLLQPNGSPNLVKT